MRSVFITRIIPPGCLTVSVSRPDVLEPLKQVLSASRGVIISC